MNYNYYNLNGDINCFRHLYFVEKTKGGYKATCLYCDKMVFHKTIDELYNAQYGQSFIQQDLIKQHHAFKYSFSEVRNFINDLTMQYPSLTNNEVVNELEIFLYTLDLSKLLISKKNHRNPLLKYYYEQKAIYTEEQMNNLINKRDNYEKVKIKVKN